MINYDATLRTFFDEIIKYLEKLATKAPDKVYADRIAAAIKSVGIIRSNPRRYIDYNMRTQVESPDMVEAFIPAKTNNNKVYLLYNSVVYTMGELDSPFDWKREAAQKKLLMALKEIKYINSTSLLKDLTYMFKSPIQFAVKEEKQK